MTTKCIKLICLSFIIVGFTTGCKNGGNKSGNILALNIDNQSNEDQVMDRVFKVSNIADSISYIPLEQTDTTRIGQIKKILIDDDRIFVFDQKLAKAVFVYSRTGKFLFKIGRLNKTGLQLTDLQDFSLDRKNKLIAIYSSGANKVTLLNYNGVLQGGVNIRESFSSVEIIDGNRYIGYREFLPETLNAKDKYDNYRLCYIDLDGSLIKGFLKGVRNKNIQLPVSAIFFNKTIDRNIFFDGPENDTIYKFNPREEKITPFLTSNLNQGKSLLRSRSYAEYDDRLKNISSIIEPPVITDNFIIGPYINKKIILNYFYDKQKKTTTSYVRFFNDIDGVTLSQANYDFYKGGLVTLINVPFYKNDVTSALYKGIQIKEKLHFYLSKLKPIAEKDVDAIVVGIIHLKKTAI